MIFDLNFPLEKVCHLVVTVPIPLGFLQTIMQYPIMQYSQLSLKRTPSGPKLFSGLERCPL